MECEKAIKDAVKYIESHITEDITIDDIAGKDFSSKQFLLSHGQFFPVEVRFHSLCRMSIQRYFPNGFRHYRNMNLQQGIV